MNFLMDRARALLGRAKKAPELATSVIEYDPIDQYVYDDLRNDAPRFREATDHKPVVGTETIENAPHLWRDLYAAHHNMGLEANLRAPELVRPDHKLFHEIMGHYVEEPDFRAAKAMTRGDRVTAGLVTMKSQQALEDALRDTLSDEAERTERMRQQIEQQQQAQQQIDDLRTQAQIDQATGGEVAQATKDAMKAAAQSKSDARRALAAEIDGMDQAGVGAQAAQAVADAAAEARDTADVWTSLPGNEVGTPSNIDPMNALELADRWRSTDEMRRKALLIGRLKRDMKAARRRDVTAGREERVGITTGNDLALLTGGELVGIAHPTLRKRFRRRYLERSLLMHQTQGTAEAGRGPVVILGDRSSSMNVNRRVWASATELALVSLAHADGRPSYVVHFNASLLGEYVFPARGRFPLETLTDCAAVGSSGGTDITKALRRARDIIRKAPEFKKADIVLITDGADNFEADDRRLVDELRAMGVQIHGVTIEAAATAYTVQACDTALSVLDLSGPSDATAQLAKLTI